jgi:hypothetical protein
VKRGKFCFLSLALYTLYRVARTALRGCTRQSLEAADAKVGANNGVGVGDELFGRSVQLSRGSSARWEGGSMATFRRSCMKCHRAHHAHKAPCPIVIIKDNAAICLITAGL